MKRVPFLRNSGSRGGTRHLDNYQTKPKVEVYGINKNYGNNRQMVINFS